MKTRPIPKTGEALPIVGVGTYRGFDVATSGAPYDRLGAVRDALFDAGGSVFDSSPMYGRAEAVTGRLLADAKAHGRAFLATKVWTRGRAAGIAQMEESLSRLRTERVDLMQVHNLVDWRTHLDTLAAWKREGRVRYVGVTHYHSGAFDDLAAIVAKEPIDFVQLDYSLEDRAAEREVHEHRDAALRREREEVLFGGGDLLHRLAREPLPSFAAAVGCATWSQLLLSYVLAHPAVTCVIPGTGSGLHMAENAAAAHADHLQARRELLAWAR
jgi:aryl-alcohol dehydrogenase-like predicted oxidoreductase